MSDPILTPIGLHFELGLRPPTRLLRRRSRDIVSVWVRGFPVEAIAHALRVDRLLIEDAIRWEMKKRKVRRRG